MVWEELSGMKRFYRSISEPSSYLPSGIFSFTFLRNGETVVSALSIRLKSNIMA